MRDEIQVANGTNKADIVLKNGLVIDVFNQEVVNADVAISYGKIVGIGTYSGDQEIDMSGKYIAPGLIDGHVHIESSLVTSREFAKVVLPHGVTSVVTDPHEIANVMGTQGLDYMLDDSGGLPVDVFIMLPSCVPCTPFENSGAVLTAKDLEPYFAHPRVLGLAEVMDYPSVNATSPDILDKIKIAKRHGKVVDGHAAGVTTQGLNVYATAGIKTDHECVTAEEAKERLIRGMYLMIREGSVARNLDALLPVVTTANSRRCLFVTDDNHLDELVHVGSVDAVVNKAIKKGLDPITAIQMATINTAECFGLHSKGAIAPGYDADIVVFDDLSHIVPSQVYKKGALVVDQGSVCVDISSSKPLSISTVNVGKIEKESLSIPLHADIPVNIIEMIEDSIVTKHTRLLLPQQKYEFTSDVQQDLLKIAVVERHKATGNIGLGIVKGFGLTKGAVATTIAHDSHNIVVIGTNDDDMLEAVNTLAKIGGGMVAISDGNVLATVELSIAGLMSPKPYVSTLENIEFFNNTLNTMGLKTGSNSMLALSFLALPVIPELKITDLGLFDVVNSKHITI